MENPHFSVVFRGEEIVPEIDCDPVMWSVGVVELAASLPPEVVVMTGEQLIKLGRAKLELATKGRR